MANVLITGASKGLGRATARELARRGHRVIATARDVKTLADLDVAARIPLDVTDDASVRRAAQEAGQVDVLINNAAEIFEAPLETAPMDEVKRLYDINLFGTIRAIQAFVPAMRERGSGTIVNVSSVVARVAFPLTSIYCSTKWALEGLSESLRIELEHFGVRVVLVEPGMIGTGALDAPRRYLPDGDPYAQLGAKARPPREQMTSPDTVASTIADAVENPQQKFRWIVGKDAEQLLGVRAKLDDSAFHAFLKDTAKVGW
jgi:NAD(P)-dependent dehydrogenase (short-subunit alcohol dehydrogenase family)